MPGDYAFYAYIKRLPEMRESVYRLTSRMAADGYGFWADKIVLAWRAHEAALPVMSRVVAHEGTKVLLQHEHDTRVRPDTLGAGRSPRLEEYLRCDPLLEIPGSVGVANEDLLNDHVEWWWTQEEGYSGHVGRILFGVFEPGEAPPDTGSFREHELFQPRAKAGSGVIQNPIEARHFVRDSIPEIEALWGTSWETLVDQFHALRDQIVSEALAAP